MFSDKTGQNTDAHTGENMDQIDTLIGENTTVKGDVAFKGGLHIDGCVEGSVSASGDGVLTLSEKGSVKGECRVPVMVINGLIEGDLFCSQRLELNADARVMGNVHYKSLEMRLGSQVNGQLACESQEVRVSKIANVDEGTKKSGSAAG